MATTIVTKSGSGAPTASDLVAGELAVDLTNKRLYTEDSGGTVIEVGSNPYNFTANHDGSAKLATTASGISVTGAGTFSGAVTVTGNLINFNTGSGNAPYIQHTGNQLDIRGGTGSTRFLNNAGSQSTVTIRDTGNVNGSGLDVTGSVTASGNVTIGNSSALTNTAGFSSTLGVKGSLPSITIEDTGTGTGKYTLGVTLGNFGLWDSTSSSYRMFVSSAGNVGIGTSSSFFTAAGRTSLSVNGTSSSILAFGKGGSSENYILADAGGLTIANTSATLPTAFFNNGSTRMTIAASGNVGIGVVPSAWHASWKALQIGPIGFVGSYQAGTTDITALGSNVYSDGTYKYIETDEAVIYKQQNGTHIFDVAPSGTADAAISWTTAMTIDNAGNVGIGTATLNGLKTVIKGSTGYPATTGTTQTGVLRLSGGTGLYNVLDMGVNETTDAAWIQSTRANNLGVYDDLLLNPYGGNVGIGTSAPDSPLEIQAATNSSSDTTYLKLYNAGENVGNIDFENGNGSLARITGTKAGAGASANDGILTFSTAFDSSLTERMRIDASGDTFFGISSKADVPTNGGVYIAGDNSVGSSNSYAQVFVVHNSNTNHGIIIKELNASGQAIQFLNSSATIVGSISTNASVTTYNTSSDYRLKENVVGMSGATERLKQLKPSRFNFIADADTTVDGFLAHEVQDIVPEAITGTKDAVDADGNPEYQGIDQSKLVPLLVATIQELEARIAALES